MVNYRVFDVDENMCSISQFSNTTRNLNSVDDSQNSSYKNEKM